MMILPTKTIKPVDSLVIVSATIIEILQNNSFTVDELLDQINTIYYKKLNVETLILALDFLFITVKVFEKNGTIKAFID